MTSGAPLLSPDSYLDASDASDEKSALTLCPDHRPDGDATSVLLSLLLQMSLGHHRNPRRHVSVIFDDAALDPHPDRCCVSCQQNDDGNSDADVSDEVSVNVSAGALGLGLAIISINSTGQK